MLKRVLVISLCCNLALLGCSNEKSASDRRVNKAVQGENSLNKAASAPKELVIYSSRNEHLVQPLFDAYTKATGVEINFLTDKAEPLIQKLKAEGERTPADILMTVDAGNLSRAANAGLLQAVSSKVLRNKVPKNLRDPNNLWFGLSMRARTIVYSPERVKNSELSSYENLADVAWKGRLCLRTSKKVYNQSLVAMLIAKHGVAKTESIVKGWVNNLATEPFSNDTKAMEAVMAGQCDVTMVNTYYLGRLLKNNSALPLKIFWPNQNANNKQLSGVHINISGAGVLKHAKHPQAAIAFLEWLLSPEAQKILAHGNLEYPVLQIANHPIVAAWGEFKQDTQSIAKAGEYQTEAVKLMNRVGYL